MPRAGRKRFNAETHALTNFIADLFDQLNDLNEMLDVFGQVFDEAQVSSPKQS